LNIHCFENFINGCKLKIAIKPHNVKAYLPPGWQFSFILLKLLICILPPLASAAGGQVQRGLAYVPISSLFIR
jgi:hypothetical protein